MFGFLKRKPKADLMEACFGEISEPAVATTTASATVPTVRYVQYGGDKFPGGYGATDVVELDYWTLRTRSAELFRKNLPARGLIRRLVTNIINTGLHLEATPEEEILGVPEDSLSDWSETVEKRFELWASNARLCDANEALSFGEAQAAALLEALVEGDVLVTLVQDQRTRLPRFRLVPGSKIQTPAERGMDRPGMNRVRHGVELDTNGRHVAFHVRQDDGKSKRLPAYGPKSGRRLAWMVYGLDKRYDDVRGEPALSLVLQGLKSLDRYRDAVMINAEAAATLAVYIQRSQPTTPKRSLTQNAPIGVATDTVIDSEGVERTYNTAEYRPGLIIDNLEPGEEPKAFQSSNTFEKYGEFEEAIVAGIAWAYEIPPEILRLAFSHNYSASQAANNEFALFLKKARGVFARGFCQPIYIEWLVGEVLTGKIEAPRLLESWRRITTMYDVYAAWVCTDWAGQVKPAADLFKTVRAFESKVDNGFTTRERAMRELSGMKYSRAMRILRKNNEALARALEPLEKAKAPPPVMPDESEEDDRDEQEEDDAETRALMILPRRKAS